MMVEYVTHRSHPNLDWNPHPKGFYVAVEILQSDAWRTLTKTESDLLLFVLSRRHYPSRKKKLKREAGKMDYWQPLNGHDITIPYKAIEEFFHRPGRMKTKAPTTSTVTRAIAKLMTVGFLDIVKRGGTGKGDMSRYRLAHNWRTWNEGDPPCFVRDGMERGRGFCQPGSGVFNPSKFKKGVELA